MLDLWLLLPLISGCVGFLSLSGQDPDPKCSVVKIPPGEHSRDDCSRDIQNLGFHVDKAIQIGDGFQALVVCNGDQGMGQAELDQVLAGRKCRHSY